jgi:energy-converting hydrogenase A subunit K
MKNYIYLLAISCLALIGVLISINMLQANIVSVIILFVIVMLTVLILKSGSKAIAHVMENLELLFMFLVFIGLLYLLYSMYYSVDTNLIL